jgi:acetylornithine deacetylase/succinyl-diaminopimelate desuccinylase-like protein
MVHRIDQFLRDTQPRAVTQLCEILRIPSISTDPTSKAAVQQSATWTSAFLKSIGFDATILHTPGCPAVFAHRASKNPHAPTVLIYGHHDVQPTGDLSRWTSPPFEPRVDTSGRIFARGSADNKGQYFLQVRALEALVNVLGDLPVHVKVLIEGEEEIGSPNLVPLLKEHRDKFKCDLGIVSDTPLWRPNRPAISLGTRGITGIEVTLHGANRDLHSGIFGGAFPNPIAELARIIAQLHDRDHRVTVPGFYDGVRDIPGDLRDEWQALSHELETEQADLGCTFTGEAGFSTLEHRWSRPTLEFNGITGGYQGPGSNTIVPACASVKITCRLVPDQDPDEIQSRVKSHVESMGPRGMRIEFKLRKSGARAYSIDEKHPAIAIASRVLTEVYGTRPVRIREGLSLPILPAFREILGADTVLLGFCDPNCQAHSFDEFFDSRDLLRGAQTCARFLLQLGQSS